MADGGAVTDVAMDRGSVECCMPCANRALYGSGLAPALRGRDGSSFGSLRNLRASTRAGKPAGGEWDCAVASGG